MDRPEPLARELVREVVLKAHGDADRVRELLTAEPHLANAAWDWGGGDWETPLGAAAHTGNREIASFLLSVGARPDLCCAAMMGWLEVVRSTIDACPAAASHLGPHGLPLLTHAEMGGEAAAAVVQYLRSLPR